MNQYPDFHVCAGQCIKWCYFLENIVETASSTKGWITLGMLWDGDDPLFCPSDSDIESWFQGGLHIKDFENGSMNLHAWISMKNGAIIDVTLLSTLATFIGAKWTSLNGKTLIGNRNNILPELRYVPLLAGRKAIDQLQAKSSVQFIATNKSELYPQTFGVLELVTI